MSGTDELLVEVAGSIAKITINRPNRLNALTIDLARRINETFLSFENNASIRVLVISSSGDRAFSAGGDVREFGKAANASQYIHELTGHLHSIVKAMRESSIVTIAMVRGAVAGAGMGLCLATDFRLCSENTRFNLAFINLALSPDTSSTFFLPRLVGWGAAARIALLGEVIEAKEAERLGLIHVVVGDEELESETEKLSLRCVKLPRLAVKRTKQLLNQSLGSSLSEQLDLERAFVAECANTGDFQEAVRAFIEKRSPKFD